MQITDHRLFKGWCAGCQTWHEAPVDVHAEVVGQGRMGVRLASLIATVCMVMRLPIRQSRELVRTLHGFEVSSGDIVEVLHRRVAYAQPALDDLTTTIRASPAVHADETGWREDGLNRSLWSVCPPPRRSSESHHSRAGDVVTPVIGEDVQGVLGSDVYAGYTIHQGLHHRCWVHVLRDVQDLTQTFPQDETLLTWATNVKAISNDAVAWAAHDPDPHLTPRKRQQARVAQQHAFEHRVRARSQPCMQHNVPHQTLCTRGESVLPEWCVCVAIPGVPAHTTLAERRVHPLVSARPISGGSRSPKGGQTRMGLASLCGTWMAQGLHPFQPSLALLTSTSSFGYV
jgi:transposase